jgi:hypothetical protein
MPQLKQSFVERAEMSALSIYFFPSIKKVPKGFSALFLEKNNIGENHLGESQGKV